MAKFNDNETQSIAATVSDVLEGKAPKKEEKKDKKENKKAVKEVEQPRVPSDKNGPETGEVDFKKKHKVKKVGAKSDVDGTDLQKEEEAKEEKVEKEEVADEQTEKQKKYQEFFQKALKRFKVKSPAELDKEGRKKFFDYVDKNYDAGENEED
tara:strand:+ start:4824 stop:5282 length:459 start_codon:yes stop_codon:yes gene_type:complete